MNLLDQLGTGKSLSSVVCLPLEADFDPDRGSVLQELADHGIKGVKNVVTGKLFLFEGVDEKQLPLLAEELLIERTHQMGAVNRFPEEAKKPALALCIAYLPGVTNPEVQSVKHAARNMGVSFSAVATAKLILLYGSLSEKDREKIAPLFYNRTVQCDLQELPKTLMLGETKKIVVETVPVRDLSDEELGSLSAKKSLFLNLPEMQAMQKHFRDLGRDPTDSELEIIAQVWSEHCGHKTFKANVVMNGQQKSSLFSRIKKVTKDLNHPDVWSCFHDNAGVVAFDENVGLAIKGETHNAPSAIEPFGGAETGVGGVIRDIMGTGKGAKPVCVFDVLCFGDPRTSREEVPRGCLHPETVFRKVVSGIQSYGNKIGLPNVSGSLFFDSGYTPKPVVLAGCLGLIDRDNVTKDKPEDGDRLVSIGGLTGRDGIHGATFSSGAMESSTKDVQSQAVQIGYPALEKRLLDVMEILRSKGLVKSVTDCGAGGFSSAVTEMASHIGAEVDLSGVSLKYSGLQPWEIFLSESQERMMVCVDKRNLQEVRTLCEHYGIHTDDLGEFQNNDRVLKVRYGDLPVAHLSLDFLFEQNPLQMIEGRFEKVDFEKGADDLSYRHSLDLSADAMKAATRDVLSHLNVCSREPIVRKYDHSVRAGNVSSYFAGRHRDTPQDATVFKPLFDRDRGFCVAHGMHPNIAAVDAYYGAQASVVESLSNLMSRGVNMSKVFLMDNFIHAKPDNPDDVGSLDREVDGLCEAAMVFGTPFVSGKDSLGGTFKGDLNGENIVIKVKPTLCVTAVGIIEDVKKALPNHFQTPGNKLYFVGVRNVSQMGGSVFSQVSKTENTNIPRLNLTEVRETFMRLQRATSDGALVSCHDVSDGGLLTTLAEMSMGEGFGCDVSLNHFLGTPAEILFNETPGCFVVEVSKDMSDLDVVNYFGDYGVLLGRVRKDDSFVIEHRATALLSLSVNELRHWIKSPLFEKFFPVGSANLQVEQDKEPDTRRTSAGLKLLSTGGVVGTGPMVTVLRAPGINSEEETHHAFELLGARSQIVDIADLSTQTFDQTQVLVVPGGFSYADDLASGKIFSSDLIFAFREQLQQFAEEDKLILGICNGFQVLVRTGLLPMRRIGSLEGNLIHNTHGFLSRTVRLEIEKSRCVWTKGLAGSVFSIPVAHGEGRFMTADPKLLDQMVRDEQVVFRYVNDEGQPTMNFPYNPNGAFRSIGGVCDPSGRILGMMPHPERDARGFMQATFSSFIGLEVLKNGVRYFS